MLVTKKPLRLVFRGGCWWTTNLECWWWWWCQTGVVTKMAPPSRVRAREGWWWCQTGWSLKYPLRLAFERGRGGGGAKRGVVTKTAPPSRVRAREGWWWCQTGWSLKYPLRLAFERGRGGGVKQGVGGRKIPSTRSRGDGGMVACN